MLKISISIDVSSKLISFTVVWVFADHATRVLLILFSRQPRKLEMMISTLQVRFREGK